MQRAQAENSKKVLSRMNGNNEQTLMALGFQAWQAFHTDYQKDKEMEDQIKVAEQKVTAFLKSKGDRAKREAEMAEALERAQGELSGFGERSKRGAKSVMERAKIHMDNMLLLKCMNTWKIEAKVEKALRMHHLKVDAKRSQLVQVQQMFRQFANELERGLRDGDSARDYGTNRSKRSLT